MAVTQLNGTEPSTNGSSHKKPHIPRHRMRNMLEDGTPVIGCFQSLTGSWAARIVASCGWDYVIVDCEHGNHDDSSMHDAVNAIAAEGVSPIVRIRGQDGGLIKRALDAGSHGVMIPMVNSADQARQIVQWSKFPPMGARGQGSSFCAMASGISVDQYVRCANQTILTFVQIETPEAVANAESIAAVPGVDGLFIGPNDLALAMLGYVPATWQEPKFVAALDAVHSACRRHGKYAGVLSKNAKHAKELMKTFDVVGAGSDVKTLTTAMRANLESIRGD